jgi:hypothetical protein
MFMISLMLITVKGMAALNGDQVLISTSQQESYPSWSESKRLINVRIVQPTPSGNSASLAVTVGGTAQCSAAGNIPVWMRGCDTGQMAVVVKSVQGTVYCSSPSVVGVAQVTGEVFECSSPGTVGVAQIAGEIFECSSPGVVGVAQVAGEIFECSPTGVVTVQINGGTAMCSASGNLPMQIKNVATGNTYHIGVSNYGAVATDTAILQVITGTGYIGSIIVDNTNVANTAVFRIRTGPLAAIKLSMTVAASSSGNAYLLVKLPVTDSATIELTTGANVSVIWETQ